MNLRSFLVTDVENWIDRSFDYSGVNGSNFLQKERQQPPLEDGDSGIFLSASNRYTYTCYLIYMHADISIRFGF